MTAAEERMSNEDALRLRNYVTDFKELPESAQNMILVWMVVDSPSIEYALMEARECESPIEKILSVALSISREMRRCASNGYEIDIYPQFEIEANGSQYRADFYFYAWHDKTDKELSLVVECDGHDFHHATKEQVKHDNEREYDLKVAGMDVLRFSGTQIFKDPMKCAYDILDYIAAKVGPNEE